MNFLKSLFTSTPQEQARSQVDKYFSSVNLTSNNIALPLTYEYLLNNAVVRCESNDMFMKELISRLTTTKSVSTTVKLFTIVHTLVYERDYNKEEIQGLQDLPVPCIQNEQEKKWFDEFAVKYVNYLRKLPSVGDVYFRAKQPKQTQHEQSSKPSYLIEVFRIINQISLLFPSISVFTNTIGRYYLTTYPEFPEFYRMLNKEITMIYSYLKTIIDEILKDYRKFDVDQLRCFMKTIPQIELVCDKMQDLLLNKYFKGKSIKAKIYIKEEKAQEIHYYLDYELQGNDIQDEYIPKQPIETGKKSYQDQSTPKTSIPGKKSQQKTAQKVVIAPDSQQKQEDGFDEYQQ